MDFINGKKTIVKGVKNKDKTKTYNANIRFVDGKIEFLSFAEGKSKKTH